VLTTILLALLAGFCVGNGLPYYSLGSTGGTNPTPFGQSSTVNMTVGWVLFVAAATCWHFAHVAAHPLAGYAAASIGLFAVGLIHARNWHNNPWRDRRPLFHRRDVSS
jgi:hypothetical protein